MTNGNTDADDIGPLFDINKLGSTIYMLALVYFIFLITAWNKYSKIKKMVRKWNSQKVFHACLVVHCGVRTLAFSTLCFFSVVPTETTPYPVLVFLFTFPEFVMLSTYCLLFLHWLEIYVFSHDQFELSSPYNLRKTYLTAFIVCSTILYILLGLFYFLLALNEGVDVNVDESWSYFIEQSVAIGSFVLVVIFSIIICYYAFILLSGFAFASAIAADRATKITLVFSVWSVGRIAKGVGLILALEGNWQTKLPDIYYIMLTCSLLTLGEGFPMLLSLDWGVVALLNMTDAIEAPVGSLQGHSQFTEQTSGDRFDSPLLQAATSVEEHTIPIEDLKVEMPPLEDVGYSFFTRGLLNGMSVGVRGLRYNGAVSPAVMAELVNETVESCALEHPNIAKFIGIARDKGDSTIYLVTQHMSRGPLSSILAASTKALPTKTVLRVARELCQAMQHVHNFAQVHGTLSSRCTMLDDKLVVKLNDTGIRRAQAFAAGLLIQRPVSVWSAPEVLNGDNPSKASDVWSYGIICWELLFRRVPYEGKTLEEVAEAICNKHERLPLPSDELMAEHAGLPASFILMVESCWDDNPRKRPSFDAIFKELESPALMSAPTFRSSTSTPSTSSSLGNFPDRSLSGRFDRTTM
eukprot:gb/GEZN01002528.1/.p1 GENE.gb/GEZN01002528.1/~~gb/GEZN01002528.1/.p1  ORF type:complete len:636 (-),score=51.69 gb/GEZN01002528.1/:134-2041(-)